MMYGSVGLSGAWEGSSPNAVYIDNDFKASMGDGPLAWHATCQTILVSHGHSGSKPNIAAAQIAPFKHEPSNGYAH